LPKIDDLLDHLSENRFSTLDLKSNYWQIKLRKKKIAFSMRNGLWQFTVMLFRLCNATFERLMEKVLRLALNKICTVYLNDVIIFEKIFREIVNNLREVFSFTKGKFENKSKEMYILQEKDKILDN